MDRNVQHQFMEARPMRKSLIWAVLLATAALTGSRTAASGTTVDFPFRDSEWLLPGQKDGGRAFVPEGVSPEVALPVVVLLHGTNERGPVHRWLGGWTDLRPNIESWIQQGSIPPVILMAPSQTSHAASGSSLWPGLDWAPFVGAAASALGSHASVDRSRVIVVGHSGAGCNPHGGLLGMAAGGQRLPQAILAIDTCLDGDVGRGLRRGLPDTRIGIFYQAQVWPRDVQGFGVAIEPGAWGPATLKIEEMSSTAEDPHNGILVDALLHGLHWISAGSATRADIASDQG
jgi:hypothetical protein